ncbi:MAG: isochorismatase family protein [Nitrospira sp.]|nr:isochorismatase family protein [Nitrospira sp.]MBS0641003.1 isochorismatase family protein [Pseudomonadota bacterium]
MPLTDRQTAALLLIDFQSRLMPAIDGGTAVIANARRLLLAARMFTIPILFTEENADGLGGTLGELEPDASSVAHKMTFDACLSPDFQKRLPDRCDLVVAGCEAHVCVLQTVLGLMQAKRRVFLVRDAVGSRRSESKEAAIQRMAQHGADIVTTEMVLFEWLATAEDKRLDEIIALIK